ncbi:MAG: methyltransferase domain-containing protein [Candidatus Odinarchaeota archaeon]
MKHKLPNFYKFHSQLDLPFSETNIKSIREIFQTLEQKFGLKRNSRQKFIDLGSGNGNVVIFAALNYNIKSVGIEINHNLILEAKSRISSLKKEENYDKNLLKKIRFKLGDFYLLNLKNYDFIYIYSLPMMHKFLKHILSTQKIGAITISHKSRLEKFNSILQEKYYLKHNQENHGNYTIFYRKCV